MAEIALRNYVKEIDELIESGRQIDLAIEHCRQILKEYPKHVATYRLLGKAFLEKKQYTDSADIFARVLSAIPDDFVSHIGMAIVREDESSFDEAIWHMERAFEANPANSAIQQELRRLILKRDGLEPQKIRLTRGALARVYAHGELYPQAIAELNAALAEDASRIDLQLLLADVHLKAGHVQQAGEISFRILEKLPNCLLANRIAAAFLIENKQPREAEPFFQRVKTMDPYAAFLTTPLEDPDTVPASKIVLTKSSGPVVSFKPGTGINQSDWAASLRSDMGETAAAEGAASELPSWLETVDDQQDAGTSEIEFDETPSIHPFEGASPPEADIPEWMRDAGWTESSGEVVEGPVQFSDNELEQLENGQIPEDAELAPADLPSWLQDVAPESVTSPPSEEEPERPSSEVVDVPDWLQGAQQEPVSRPEPAETGELDEPYAASAAGSEGESQALEEIEQDVDLESEESGPSLPSWLEEATPGATETIVTWLGDKSRDSYRKPELSASPPSEEPEILEEDLFSEEPSLPVEPGLSTESEESEIMGTEFGLELEPKSGKALESEPVIEETPPEWLDTISDSPQEKELAEEQVEMPDWLETMSGQAGGPASAPPAAASESSSLMAEDEEMLDETPGQDLPEWLTQSTDDLPSTAQEVDEADDWLAEEDQPAEIASSEAEEDQWASALPETPVEIEPTPEYIPEPSDLDWLDELVEDTPDISAPTTPSDSPEWLAGVIDQEDIEEEDFASMEADEIDWLKDFSGEQAPSDSRETAESPVGDDWFSGVIEEPEEQSDEADWFQQVVRSEDSEEVPDITASDTPTLVSDTQWNQKDGSINERPTIPSTRSVLESDELSGIEEEISEEPETDADIPEPDTDALLAEIIARNTPREVPETLRATQDELESLKSLESSEGPGLIDEIAPSPAELDEIDTGVSPDALPVEAEVEGTEELEEGPAPDWLTELATEEGFTASASSEPQDVDKLEEIFPSEESGFEVGPQPVEWLPEEESSRVEEKSEIPSTVLPEEKIAEAIPEMSDLLEEESQIETPIISEEEIEEALDWLEETTSKPEPETPALQEEIIEPEAESQTIETLPPAEEEEEAEPEDFFETLAEVEEVQTEEPPSDKLELEDEVESISIEEKVIPEPDSTLLTDVPAPLAEAADGELEAAPIEKPAAEVIDTSQEPEEVETVEPEIAVEETAIEEVKPEVEYKKTGILSQRDLPEDITSGLEWLSDLAEHHDKPISGINTQRETESTEKVAEVSTSGLDEERVDIPSDELDDDEFESVDEIIEPVVDGPIAEEETAEIEDISTQSAEDTEDLLSEEPEAMIPEEKKIWKVTLTARKEPDGEEEVEPEEPIQTEESEPEVVEPESASIKTETDEEPAWLRPSDEAIEPPPAEQDEKIPEWLQSDESAEPPAAPEKSTAEVTVEREEKEEKPAKKEPETIKAAKRKTEENDDEIIKIAREAMEADDLNGAIEYYRKLIKRRKYLQECIDDLRSAIVDHPNSSLLWQTLGDAYMQNNQPTAAIEAYQHGMDVA